MNSMVYPNRDSTADTIAEALNACMPFKANDLEIKRHTAIVTFGNPKLNEYFVAGEGWEANETDVSNRLVLPAYDLDGTLCNLAYIEPNQPTIFAYPNHDKRGLYSFNNPAQSGFAYVVIDIVAAFKISAAGLPCILIAPITAQHGAPVHLSAAYEYQLKATIKAITQGGLKIYCPVACHEKNDYTRALGGLDASVLPLAAGIGVYDDPTGIKGQLESTRRELQAKDKPEVTKTKPVRVNDNHPLVFDEFTPFPEVGGNGKPKATIENLRELLRRMGAVVRYNVIKKTDEIIVQGKSFCSDNAANASIGEIISHCNRVGMPTGHMDMFLGNVAAENPYNPIMNWVTSKEWDGVKRWDDFCDTITPKNVIMLPNGMPLHKALIRRWMVSAIAAAASAEGISAQGMLVLQGDQGLGKTNWFKSLIPSDLKVTKDGFLLRPDDKDNVKQAVSNFMVELGEIDASFRRTEAAALKAFITRDYDELRLPYARRESNFPRRTVFFGSVNPKTFLHDETGNRRFWTIECAGVNWQHDFDMQQVWAEVYELYKQGMHWHLSADEFDALNTSNEDFQVIDPIEERLLSKLEWNTDPSRWRWVTTTDLLIEIGIDKPTRADTIKASTCIRKHNHDQARRSHGKNLVLVPELINFMSNDFKRRF